jgi:hypothetical protein
MIFLLATFYRCCWKTNYLREVGESRNEPVRGLLVERHGQSRLPDCTQPDTTIVLASRSDGDAAAQFILDMDADEPDRFIAGDAPQCFDLFAYNGR